MEAVSKFFLHDDGSDDKRLSIFNRALRVHTHSLSHFVRAASLSCSETVETGERDIVGWKKLNWLSRREVTWLERILI